MLSEIHCSLVQHGRQFVCSAEGDAWQELGEWSKTQEGGEKFPQLHGVLHRPRPLQLKFFQVQMLRDECETVDHTELSYESKSAFATLGLLIEQALDARAGVEIADG